MLSSRKLSVDTSVEDFAATTISFDASSVLLPLGSKSGISTCTDCPQGKWQSSQGQTGCYRCPKGMYQPFAGFWSCYKCAVGQYANEYGKTKCTGCTQCPRGQYGTTKAVGSVDH